MSQKTNEQFLLNEINTRVKQYMKEHTQENDQSDEEYYHRFLHQHAGCISGMAEVLKINEHDWDWRAYSEQLIIYEVYRNKNKMYRVFFVDNAVLVIILLLLGFICASIVTDTVVSVLKYIKLY